jgi:DNA polymerase-3 subunit gamma/tau
LSYQSLARKYRPRTFLDLVGQEATAAALRNAINLKREPSAVIFSGVRGVGKTTTARLYAKALNCAERRDGEPCDRCASCLSINEGTHEDVLEIDGASHNGVEEVRQLQESLAYVNQRSPYKIFIIDEVHMLSINAFNALLKTLEEPPPQVVFILATTNLQKVPQTIIGRCHTFYLQKISLQAIVERLKIILNCENIVFEDKALYLIAKEGQGSLRDAVTFLDQVIALGAGTVTLASLQQFLTQVSNEVYLQLIAALLQRDGATCISIVEQLEQRGVAYTQVLDELASLARHGFVLKDSSINTLDFAALGLDAQDCAELQKLALHAPPLELNRLFRVLVRCKQELDGSSLDRFVVENCLLEWCLDPGLPSTEQLLHFAQHGGQESLFAASAPPPLPAGRPAPATRPTSAASAAQEHTTLIEQVPPHTPHEKKMPASWPELVTEWKKHQPLEARKLEEVHLLIYSPKKIEVAVAAQGIIGPQLLRPGYQMKISQQLAQLFGFSGQFRAIPMAADSSSKSLLDEKNRALQIKQQELSDAARLHPLTQALVETMGGKILGVQTKGEL